MNNNTTKGKSNNTSEVILTGLSLLEKKENKIVLLKKAINAGIESGVT